MSGIPDGRSATFDAFIRLSTGQSERTIADKINDKNRPTWEQYKKDNEDKLHLEGLEMKKTLEYRRKLDAEREARLAVAKERRGDEASGTDDSSDDRKKKKKKKKKKHKRKHHHKDDASNDDDRPKSKKRRRRDDDLAETGNSIRLPEFLKEDSSA